MAPNSGPYRSNKSSDSKANKDSDQPKKLIPVAPSYALGKSIIRPQLDGVGAPFYAKVSVNKFLSAKNMLESKLHPGAHELCNRMGFGLSLGGSSIEHGAKWLKNYGEKPAADVLKSFGVSTMHEMFQSDAGKKYVAAMAFMNGENSDLRSEEDLRMHLKRWLRYLTTESDEKIKAAKRLVSASSTLYVFALEHLAQLLLANNVEQWQEIMAPTKDFQSTAVKTWFRKEPENVRALVEALAQSYIEQKMNKKSERTNHMLSDDDDDKDEDHKASRGRGKRERSPAGESESESKPRRRRKSGTAAVEVRCGLSDSDVEGAGVSKKSVTKRPAPDKKADAKTKAAKKECFVMPADDDASSDTDTEKDKLDPILEISMIWTLEAAKDAVVTVETWATKIGDKKDGPNIHKIRDLLSKTPEVALAHMGLSGMVTDLANKDRLGKNQMKPLLETYLKTAMGVLNFLAAQALETKEALVTEKPLASGRVTPTGEAAPSTPVELMAPASPKAPEKE